MLSFRDDVLGPMFSILLLRDALILWIATYGTAHPIWAVVIATFAVATFLFSCYTFIDSSVSYLAFGYRAARSFYDPADRGFLRHFATRVANAIAPGCADEATIGDMREEYSDRVESGESREMAYFWIGWSIVRSIDFPYVLLRAYLFVSILHHLLYWQPMLTLSLGE